MIQTPGSLRSNLGANHFMTTSATLQDNGLLQASTITETGTFLGGYTGGVKMLGTDANDVVIWQTVNNHHFGIDGRFFGSGKRIDQWSEWITPGLVPQTTKLVVVHFWAPKVDILRVIIYIGMTLAQLLFGTDDSSDVSVKS